MKVWVLLIYMSWYNTGGPVVIDNIATQQECVRIQQIVRARSEYRSSQCMEVHK